VNPFKALNIYSNEHVEKHRSAKDPAQLPAHIYGIGRDAFTGIAETKQSQAVLISGESGAGKTESTKLVLLYISEVLMSDTGFSDKVLEINPILESFGNAKTSRNNNSSRFGKWIEMFVDPTAMMLTGASVTEYLLEVTRVCAQGPDERNYHIFYQLCTKGALDTFNSLQLRDPSTFSYLKRNPAQVAGINDEEGFMELLRGFTALQFTADEQEDIVSVVAGILHLGDLEFQTCPGDKGKSEPADPEALDRVAAIFGVEAASLRRCACYRRVVAGKDTVETPLDREGSKKCVDSIAKLTYGRLFRWLISRCNEALGLDMAEGSSSNGPFIGVLDIAGFESFDTNMLEQLLINLSNEKMQQFFNNKVFKTELADYTVEGVDVGFINFTDNADVLTLVEGKGGLLAILDDATTGVKQTDSLYTSQAIKAHEKHGRFIKPKFTNQLKLGIRHYAGDVIYSTEGFLEKNSALEPPEVLELMASSKRGVLRALAQEADADAGASAGAAKAGRAVRKATVSSKFRRSLQQLIDKLSEAQAHFVRCVKPNTAKVPGTFQSGMVLDQLRLSGIFEAVKIRKAGYPVRMPCAAFVKRYLMIVSKAAREKVLSAAGAKGRAALPEDADAVQAAQALIERLVMALGEKKVSDTDYRMGKTKTFLTDGLHKTLEQYRRLAFAGPALAIQAAYRGWKTLKLVAEVREINTLLARCMEDVGQGKGTAEKSTKSVIEKLGRATVMEGSLASMELLIRRAELVPERMSQLTLLGAALKARARVASEAQLARQMQNLTSSMDVPAMQAALARAAVYSMKAPVLETLEERIATLQAQLPLRRILKNAAVMDELEAVQEGLQKVRAAGLEDGSKWLLEDGPRLFEEALQHAQKLEEELKKKAAEAEEAANAEAERLAAEAAARVKAEGDAKAAEEIEEMKSRIATAAEEFDARELADAFRDADELGLAQSEYEEAHRVFMSLQDGDFIIRKLAELRNKTDSDAGDLLAVSNLTDQLDELGLKDRPMSEDMRNVAAGMVSERRKRGLSTVFDIEGKLAGRCFEDLSNFSQLRDPLNWGTHGPVRKAADAEVVSNHSAGDLLKVMLQWQGERITEPLTWLDPSFEMLAVRNFGNLLRCMGDKPSAYIGDKEEPMLTAAVDTEALRDEIFIHLMKQLAENPSADSATRGWHLFGRLCQRVLPGEELCEFVQAFLQRAATSEEGDTHGTRRPSFAAGAQVLLRQDASGPAAWSQKRKALAADVLKTFQDARARAETAAESAAHEDAAPPVEVQPEIIVVNIKSEDGQHWPCKVRSNQTIGQIRDNMIRAMSLSSQAGPEVYALFVDRGGGYSSAQLLPPDLDMAAAQQELQTIGGSLLFGRLNVGQNDDLPVGDLPGCRFTFLHARRQFLEYTQTYIADDTAEYGEEEDGSAGTVSWLAGALLRADRAQYCKPRKGRGNEAYNAKVETMDSELAAGLLGKGVLERYVPAAQLALRSREDWSRDILAAMKDSKEDDEEDDADSTLVLQGRAMSLMQQWMPDFEAYVWGLATQLLDAAVVWQQQGLCWTSRVPAQLPENHVQLCPEEPSSKLQLLLTHDGLEVRAVNIDIEGLWLPFRRGTGRHHLAGWHPMSGSKLALCVSVRQRSKGNAVLQVPMNAVLQVPDGLAPAISAFLMRYFAMS